MTSGWQARLADRLPAGILKWDDESLIEYSRDYHSFSHILTRELEDKLAQCVVSPTTEEELDAALSFAAEAGVPITARGAGTGNYGQCVPLLGGIVLNMAKYNKVLEIGNGFLRVQSGARLGKMESVGRKAGMELRCMPSTFQSATVGGFLCGGFGGIGSISWGTIWDGLVRFLTVKTVEASPRTLLIEGKDALPYLHTYGTVGVISEVEINMAPRTEWEQWAVTFQTFNRAFAFGRAVAEDQHVRKRLISVNEQPISKYFLPFDLPEHEASVLLETDQACRDHVTDLVELAGGTVRKVLPAEQYHLGIGVSDFSWNHTTLWARKTDSRITYLQVGFDAARVDEQLERIRRKHPEVMNHIEFASQGGKLLITGLPLLPFTSDRNINAVITDYEQAGVRVSNPHTWDLEDGGRSYDRDRLWEIKRRNDPLNLLNPGKLRCPDSRPVSSPKPAALVDGKLALQVSRIRSEAKGILSLELRDNDGLDLPAFSAGSHIGLYLPNGARRLFSLLNDPRERHRYVVAVALTPSGRGGARFVHGSLRQGDRLLAEPPRNNFSLDEHAGGFCLLAGGIGITPILSMMRRCIAMGKEWRLVYCAHNRLRAAFFEELQAMGDARISFHFTEEHEGQRMDARALVSSLKDDEHLYCCGPASLMQGVKRATGAGVKERVHFEWFAAPEPDADQVKENTGFEVTLRRRARKIRIEPSQSILEALEDQDIEAPFFCRSGICRTCETGVCTGTPDHRDFVLTEEERAGGKKMMICVSRALTPHIELDL